MRSVSTFLPFVALLGCESASPPEDARASADASLTQRDIGPTDAPSVDAFAPLLDVPASTETVCGSADPSRVFFQDFEGGAPFGTDAHTQFGVRTGGMDEFAVIPGERMAGRAGHVLRGNMYEWVEGRSGTTRVADPLALAYGLTALGTKSPGVNIRLADIGIRQVPSRDFNEVPDGNPARAYISVWLWMDADFTFDARWEDDSIRPQTVKLFYAFGPNSTMWVTTTHGDGGQHFLNANNLGSWETDFDSPDSSYFEHPDQLGSWHHWEFYFQSETRPLFYEYGGTSTHPEWLSHDCAGVRDYEMAFPVIGSDPPRCMTSREAFDANSRDGRYVVRIDGNVVMDHRHMPWNGRFGGFNFPAWHGGGGQAIGNAGWAIDEMCVRTEAPPGFLP